MGAIAGKNVFAATDVVLFPVVDKGMDGRTRASTNDRYKNLVCVSGDT